MGTTTIRVDRETHARLLELSRERGSSVIDTVRDATEALARQRFAGRVAIELDGLRGRSDEWDAYVGEAEATGVPDGLG
jgi:hypothetical protein